MLEASDPNASAVKSFLSSNGICHQILDNMYYFSTETNHTAISLRDTILEDNEDSRIFVFRFEDTVSAAWKISVENSNWLKENM